MGRLIDTLNTVRLGAGDLFVKTFGLDTMFLTGQEHEAFGDQSGGGKPSIRNAYSASWIAYACIEQQAKDIAGVPIKILKDPDDLESEIPPTSPDPFVRLFGGRPSPNLSMTDFVNAMVVYYKLRGACFIVFDDPNSPTHANPFYDPLHWSAVKDLDAVEGVGYRYRRGSKTFAKIPDDIISLRMFDPADPSGWQSPLESAAAPVQIGILGDRLNASTIAGGGERTQVFASDKDIGDSKYKQLVTRIRNSRTNKPGTPPRPLILTNGLKPQDGRFTTSDLNILEQQDKSAEKITAIYGMSPSMLFRDEMPNRDTYRIRVRQYWTRTIIPTIRAIEGAFDLFSERWGAYLRFDLTDVEALQEDYAEQVKIGKELHSMNVPIIVINQRLKLGLDTDLIPGADDTLVPIHMAPASAIFEGFDDDAGSPDGAKAPALRSGGLSLDAGNGLSPSGVFKITEAEILRRHKSPADVIARNKMRFALESGLMKKWRGLMNTWKTKAVKVAEVHGGDVDKFEDKLREMTKPLSKAMVETVAPFHNKAAIEGVLSIMDLVDEKRWIGTERAADFRKAPELPDEALDVITERQNYITGKLGPDIFDDIMGEVFNAVTADEGPTAIDIARMVRSRFNVSINRAITIGRTEVGTAYNVSRFAQTKAQGFKKHRWLTSADELVRGYESDDPFNHVSSNDKPRTIGKAFPCGLKYPQEQGGEAGNVINCRCVTIPLPNK